MGRGRAGGSEQKIAGKNAREDSEERKLLDLLFLRGHEAAAASSQTRISGKRVLLRSRSLHS